MILYFFTGINVPIIEVGIPNKMVKLFRCTKVNLYVYDTFPKDNSLYICNFKQLSFTAAEKLKSADRQKWF